MSFSLDGGSYQKSNTFSIVDSGQHEFIVIDQQLEDSCSGNINIIAGCLQDSCLNTITVENKTVDQGAIFKVEIKLKITDTLSSCSLPLKWNPTVLEYKRIDNPGHINLRIDRNSLTDLGELGIGIQRNYYGDYYYDYYPHSEILDSMTFSVYFEAIGRVGEETMLNIQDNRYTFFQMNLLNEANVDVYKKQGLIKIADIILRSEEEIPRQKVTIFPNPSARTFRIKFPDGTPGQKLNIYDSTGRKEYSILKTGDEMELSFLSSSSGLKLIYLDNQFVGKVLITDN